MFKPMVFGRYGLLIYFLIIFYVIYYYGRYPVIYKPVIGHCNEPIKDFCSDSFIVSYGTYSSHSALLLLLLLRIYYNNIATSILHTIHKCYRDKICNRYTSIYQIY